MGTEESGEFMITDSRFHMWRAVIALAHADNRIDDQEREFADNYLVHVPFSDEQKVMLRRDLDKAQDVQAMFNKITDRADQAEFFEFARMIVWCDGNLDEQEDKIFEYVKDAQMFTLNEAEMRKIVRETRESGKAQRAAEDAQFEADADKLLGFRAVIRRGFGKRKAL